MKRAILLAISLFLGTVAVCHGEEAWNPGNLLAKSRASYEKVSDYRCLFHKKELIRGKLREERAILLKFKKPASFYLKYTEGKNAGVEAIYVEGKYNDELEVHLSGLLSFISLGIDPRGSLALRNNRHPIMEAGTGHILQLIEKNYRMAQGDKESRITFEGESVADGEKALLFKGIFPKGKGYYGHTVLVWFDRSLLLPVKITVYGWDNEFLEEYSFKEIKLNVGLTERDFDKANPEYHF